MWEKTRACDFVSRAELVVRDGSFSWRLIQYSGIPIFRSSKGNGENWFEKSGGWRNHSVRQRTGKRLLIRVIGKFEKNPIILYDSNCARINNCSSSVPAGVSKIKHSFYQIELLWWSENVTFRKSIAFQQKFSGCICQHSLVKKLNAKYFI